MEDYRQRIAESTPSGGLAYRALHDIDVRLARLVVPYDDWEVLYRQRLQVEGSLRQSHRRDEGDGRGPMNFAVDLIRRLVD